MGLFSSKQKSKTKVTPYDQAQLNAILGRLRGLGETPFEYFPGQTYADLQPLQEEALRGREAYGRGLGGMVDPTLAAWRSTLTAPDVAANPYVQGMIEAQGELLNRNLAENILPTIASGAIGAGQLGGSRQGVAEGIAARGTQEALGRLAAETQLGAYGQGLAQQRYGLGAAPGMAGFGLMPSDVLMGVGDIRRTEAQRGIDEAMARHEFAQEEPWRRTERQAGLYHPLASPYKTTETTSKTSPSALGVAGQIAGLGLAGAGMYQGFGLGGGGPAAGTYASPPGGWGAGYPTMGRMDPWAGMNRMQPYGGMMGY